MQTKGTTKLLALVLRLEVFESSCAVSITETVHEIATTYISQIVHADSEPGMNSRACDDLAVGKQITRS